jgi:hypothetical protein
LNVKQILALLLTLGLLLGCNEQETAQLTDTGVAGAAADEDSGLDTEPVAAKSEALSLPPAFCYTAQVTAVKAKLQGPLYYCKGEHWTYDGWNLYNPKCSSTNSYGLWVQMARHNNQSTCVLTVSRTLPNNGGYCIWKRGTVNGSGSSVTLTDDSDPNDCW